MAPKRPAEEEPEEDPAEEDPAEEEEEEDPAEEEDGDSEEEPAEEEDDEYVPEEKPSAKKAKKAKKEASDDEDDEEEEEEEEQAADVKKTKKKAVSCTLDRSSGTLGIAMSGNYITAVHPGGAAAKEGTIKVGDVVTEVNGKDTVLNTFASLIPKDTKSPLKIRLQRFVEI